MDLRPERLADRTSRWASWMLLLAANVVLAGTFVVQHDARLSTIDYGTQWVAARVVLDGEDPYDDATYDAHAAAYDGFEPGHSRHFFHLPNQIGYLLPFGPLGQGASQIAFFASSLLVLNLALLYGLRRIDVFPAGRRPGGIYFLIFLGLLFLFRPLWHTLFSGQRSHVALAALLAYLVHRHHRPGRDSALRGAVLSVTLVKANLLLPVYAYVLGRATVERRRRFLLGFAAAALLPVLVAMLWRPSLLLDFLADDRGYAGRYLNPSFGPFLAFRLDLPLGPTRWLPALVLTATGALLGFGERDDEPDRMRVTERTAMLVAAGLLFAPYVWPYDYVLFFAPFLVLFLGLPPRGLFDPYRAALAGWLLLSSALLSLEYVQWLNTIWFPAASCLLYLVMRREFAKAPGGGDRAAMRPPG
ncbi:MAG: glycosyltransferase 87 family protein [Gemmatimonadota bacterium]|nr:glycosyltransferase 87 family protein [Gemmatimonadota bacterium]